MTYVRNPIVHWLLSHAYGQGGTVAVPTSSGTPRRAGCRSAHSPSRDRRRARPMWPIRHTAWTSAARRSSIGVSSLAGPGNGKSESMRSVAAARLGVTLPPRAAGAACAEDDSQSIGRLTPTPLANGLGIAFINDASIPRQDMPGNGSTPVHSFQDVADALDRTAQAQADVAVRQRQPRHSESRNVATSPRFQLGRRAVGPSDDSQVP